MLIEFRVENHRSLLAEAGVTFEAGAVTGDEARLRAIGGTKLVPVAAIYGANASGKSNVLSGLQFMRDAVIDSQRFWEPDEGVPRDPFAWDTGPGEPTVVQAAFFINGIRYEYGFVVDDDAVREEWLWVWPHGRKQTWFEREELDFTFGEHLKGENRAVQELTRRNSLFLSAAAQNNPRQLSEVYSFFSNMRFPRARHRWSRAITVHDGPARWFSDSPRPAWPGNDPEELKADFLRLLRMADVGILNVRRRDGTAPQLELQHRLNPEDRWLPLEAESEGTQQLFNVGPMLLNGLANGGVVVVDELERSLHPRLVLELLRMFHDPATNVHNAQLVFTTHDTSLLGSNHGEDAAVLRRDQIWLAEKGDDGASGVYPLTDYKPRKSENLERGYLQGRYRGVPFVGPRIIRLSETER